MLDSELEPDRFRLLRENLVDVGFEVATGTPEEFSRLLKEETTKWAEVVKRTGLQLDY